MVKAEATNLGVERCNTEVGRVTQQSDESRIMDRQFVARPPSGTVAMALFPMASSRRSRQVIHVKELLVCCITQTKRMVTDFLIALPNLGLVLTR